MRASFLIVSDCLKFNFVKDINAVGQKMTGKGHEMANSQFCLFFYAYDYKSVNAY